MLLIALCYVLLMFQFLLIAVIMVLQSIFLIKTSILVFPVAAGCLMMSGNIKELTCWQPKVVGVRCPSFPYCCFLLISWENGQNDPHLEVILTSITLLVCIRYRFSKPQNMLKSCFTSQFFTHDIIEIIDEVNTSYLESDLSIFALSKIRFKNDKSFYLLLPLLSGDIRDLK